MPETTAQPQQLDPILAQAALAAVASRLRQELELAETKALKALAGYKFVMFGYHAAQWVLLARVAGGGRPSPFRNLVLEARLALEARQLEAKRLEAEAEAEEVAR